MRKTILWTSVSINLQLVYYFKTGYTTLWRDHFGSARFVVALFGIAHFIDAPFWSGPFWRKFQENNFFVLIFLIYKKIFRLCFSFFFQKQLKEFLFICNTFLSTLHKK